MKFRLRFRNHCSRCLSSAVFLYAHATISKEKIEGNNKTTKIVLINLLCSRLHNKPKPEFQFIRPFLSSDAEEHLPKSLVYQGSLARQSSFLVFGVRYEDCGVFGTTLMGSSYDSSSSPSAYCRNRKNKTKSNFI